MGQGINAELTGVWWKLEEPHYLIKLKHLYLLDSVADRLDSRMT